MLEAIHQVPFYELTALLVTASLVGVIGLYFKQPMVVSFIAVGLLIGPSGLDLIQSHEHIELFAELGIALLLFLVGLKLDLQHIRTLGMVSLATGLGQVFFTSFIGFFIGLALGFDVVKSSYIAVALTFSSTIIIIKLLSDKKEVDLLHGKIAVGFLIVQDLVVVFAMMILSAFGMKASQSSDPDSFKIIQNILAGAGLLAFLLIFIKFIATPLMRKIAKSAELMIIFSIGWAAFLASLGNYLGFSKELGGLLAGISLASTPFRESIITRLSSLRDFLLLFFFVALGSKLDLGSLGSQLFPAIILSLFVLIGNPLIVMVIMGTMGYRKRTSFLAGLTVAQISEFSLIFISMGITLAHLQNDSIELVTLVGLITIALSVYMISYSQRLFIFLEPLLAVFERKNPFREKIPSNDSSSFASVDIVLFGLGRYGAAISNNLIERKLNVLAYDYDPSVVREFQNKFKDSIRVQYGDIYDHDFLDLLPINSIKCVIIAIPHHDHSLSLEDPRVILTKNLRHNGFKGKIAVATHRLADVDKLKSYGVDMVFVPFHDAAKIVVEKIVDQKC